MKIRKDGKVINLTETDLRRIVKRVLSEQDNGEPVGGGLKITKGFKFQNGLEVMGDPTYRRDTKDIVMIPRGDGSFNEFSCTRHERGRFYLYPGHEKNSLTQEESQALYDQFCRKESGEIVGGGLKITKGFKFQNGLEMLGNTKEAGEGKQKIIWIQTEDGGAGQNFSCGRHEQGKYYLTPAPEKHKLTQGESQALYDQYCKK